MNKNLTIVIPAYNYGHYLGLAIESCLSSKVWVDVLIIDNASTDDTPALLRRYESVPQVRSFRNSTLLPIQENWNYAVSLVQTPWVKLLQADDFLLPGGIERIVELIHQNPDREFIAHYGIFVDADGQRTREQRTHGDSPVALSKVPALKAKLRQAYRFREPSSNLFLKEAWTRVGGYDETRRFTFDVHFNVKLLTTGRTLLVPERLSAIRRHASSDGAKLPALLALDEVRLLCEDILDLLASDASFGDQCAAIGWIQFRLLELCAQKLKKKKKEALMLLAKRGHLLLKFWGWPSLGALLWRRAVRKDIQGDLRHD